MNMVSIIIPCRNEEKYIEKCLKSVLDFTIAADMVIEVLVVDGFSEDATVKIVKRIANIDQRIKLLTNPGKIQAIALNIAIKEAKGFWILRLDAHSKYPKDYLKLCYETAVKTEADNVGGLFITQPGDNTYQAQLVQALTTHPFGVGNAGFRIGMPAGETDTVPYGFYKKDIFEKIGLLDERLVRAQDYEFNRRLIKSGGKIWQNPNIHVFYYNQPTLWKFLKKQLKFEAPYNAYMWYLAPYSFAYRHAITGFFTIGIISGIILSPYFSIIKMIFFSVAAFYTMLALISSLQQASRYKQVKHMLYLPFSFFLYHFLHGLGILKGLGLLLFRKAPVQKIKEPWKGYGSYRIKVRKLI